MYEANHLRPLLFLSLSALLGLACVVEDSNDGATTSTTQAGSESAGSTDPNGGGTSTTGTDPGASSAADGSTSDSAATGSTSGSDTTGFADGSGGSDTTGGDPNACPEWQPSQACDDFGAKIEMCLGYSAEQWSVYCACNLTYWGPMAGEACLTAYEDFYACALSASCGALGAGAACVDEQNAISTTCQ